MSLSPRLVAIQGIGFTPVQIAVQGLLDYIASGKHLHQDTDQGKAGKNPPDKDYLSENLKRAQEARDRKGQEEYNLTRLQQDDQDATEFIMALLTKGILDECHR
jgi:hypothetical protein